MMTSPPAISRTGCGTSMTSIDHRLVVTAAAFDGAMCGCRSAPQDFQKDIVKLYFYNSQFSSDEGTAEPGLIYQVHR